MGVSLAEAARDRGANVTLIAGGMSVDLPAGVGLVKATTASEMRDAVLSHAPHADVLVMAAAVADFAPAQRRTDKIKRDGSSLQIELLPNPDIVAEVGRLPDAERPFTVGFAAETGDLIARASAKLVEKRLGLVVANAVGGAEDAIGSDDNRVTVLAPEGEIASWPRLPKRQVAERLWDVIGDRYRQWREEAGSPPGDRAATEAEPA